MFVYLHNLQVRYRITNRAKEKPAVELILLYDAVFGIARGNCIKLTIINNPGFIHKKVNNNHPNNGSGNSAVYS